MIHETIKTRVVGVDIQIDTTTLAVIDVRGNIIARESFTTGTNPNIGDFASILSERVMSIVEQNGGYESIRSLGICSPSANYMTSCIENAPNLPWKGVVPLAAMMRDRLGLAVALGNNAYARGLGELAFGVAHGIKDFVLLTMGGGVGSCIFINGQYYAGHDGFAGEIGHSMARHAGDVLCAKGYPHDRSGGDGRERQAFENALDRRPDSGPDCGFLRYGRRTGH